MNYILKYLFLTSALPWLMSCSAGETEVKPNIIWLMAEDISLDLECYDMAAVKTPHLNKLAMQGVKFENCFVTNSICSPSRSAMMVGTHQLKINAHHHRSNRNEPLQPDHKPFTYWLRKNGYTTVLGHHAVMGKGRKIDVNFKSEALGPWDGESQFGLFDKYDHFEKEDEPFFAQVQLVVTHRGDWWDDVRSKSAHPVNPDSVVLPPYLADHPTIRLDWAKYLDQMEYMDAEVGMILQELEQKGLDDNTIIIFIGDNGRCNLRGKGYLHDTGLHIPLIIYDPRGNKGMVRKDVVAATDITATILDYAGVEIPGYMSGRPIFDPDFQREYVFGTRDLWDEIAEKSRAVTSADWKYIRNDKPGIPFDAKQAYVEFYRPALHIMRKLNENGTLNSPEQLFFQPYKPGEELYNLEHDPHELQNLANDPKYTPILEQLRAKTKEVEEQMKPVSDVYDPVRPRSMDVLQWVKTERPAQYQQMLDGVEIGFQGLVREYQARETEQ